MSRAGGPDEEDARRIELPRRIAQVQRLSGDVLMRWSERRISVSSSCSDSRPDRLRMGQSP